MFKLKILDEDIWKPYIKNGELSISIIGNGGIDGSDNDKIDSCNCHVRFNNYATRADIKDQWGHPNYCDVLFSTLDLHSKGCAAKDVVIAVPFPFKQQRIARIVPKWYPKARKWMVNPYLNVKLAEGMGYDTEGWKHPFPSVGATALMHILHHTSQLKIKLRVFVAGFAWYYNEKTNKFQNWDLRRTDYPKTWNHNYPLEVEWVIDNLLDHPRFVFGHKTAKIIEAAKKLINERRSATK